MGSLRLACEELGEIFALEVGGMGEHIAARDVAHCVDAFDGRAQMVVGLNKPCAFGFSSVFSMPILSLFGTRPMQ